MDENMYFNIIQNQISKLSKKEYETLEEFLGNMEEKLANSDKTIKDFENYIKRFKRKNKILFITFKTKNKKELAHICKYILNLEWNNEWALAVAGQHTRTIFGWYD